MRTTRALAAVAALAIALSGCRIDVEEAAPEGYHRMPDGTLMADAEAVSNGHDHDVDPADFPQGVTPVRLVAATIGIDAPIVATTMTNERIQGPPVAGDVAWLEQTRRPGEIGPAILGGVDVFTDEDGVAEPGVYDRLLDLAPGDEIEVLSADGESVTFVVDAVWSQDLDERIRIFDAGDPRAEIRLVDWAVDGETVDHVVSAFELVEG